MIDESRLVGVQSGWLTIIRFDHVKDGQSYWLCNCKCGSNAIVRGSDIVSGTRKSCSRECAHKMHALEYVGKKFGQLMVIGIARINSGKPTLASVMCDCGKSYQVKLTRLVQGVETRCLPCKKAEKYLYLVGQKFGRLKAVAITWQAAKNSSDYGRHVLVCACDCGGTKTVAPKDLINSMVRSCGCLNVEYRKNRNGSKNPNWKGGITEEWRSDRSSQQYWEWQGAVFGRDGNTCQKCGFHDKFSRGLNAHHILNFGTYKALRFDINNGITLCGECHVEFHGTYGSRENTREQIVEFLSSQAVVA